MCAYIYLEFNVIQQVSAWWQCWNTNMTIRCGTIRCGTINSYKIWWGFFFHMKYICMTELISTYHFPGNHWLWTPWRISEWYERAQVRHFHDIMFPGMVLFCQRFMYLSKSWNPQISISWCEHYVYKCGLKLMLKKHHNYEQSP